MNEPKISVIIPVYNAAPWLPSCLGSIAGQSYRNLEIICVDDGSTDGSLSVLQKYAEKDSRFKLIHQENAGVSVARNHGVDAATGEWIAFADADDWLDEAAFACCMACVTDEVDIVHYGTAVEGHLPEAERKLLENDLRVQNGGGLMSPPWVYGSLNMCIWNKLFRRSLLQHHAIRFPEGVAYAEDLAFCCCALAVARSMHCLPEKFYHYRVSENSAMGALVKKSPRSLDHLRAVEWLCRFCKRTRRMGNMLDFLRHFFICLFVKAKETIASECMEQLYESAYRLGKEMDLLRWRGHWCIQELLRWRYGRSGRWYRFVENRGVYSLFSLPVFSVTYEPERTVYRFLGRVVWKNTKENGLG